MPISPEDRARENIDRPLTASGSIVQSRNDANINTACGVTIRKFPPKSGYGEADYLLYVFDPDDLNPRFSHAGIDKLWGF